MSFMPLEKSFQILNKLRSECAAELSAELITALDLALTFTTQERDEFIQYFESFYRRSLADNTLNAKIKSLFSLSFLLFRTNYYIGHAKSPLSKGTIDLLELLLENRLNYSPMFLTQLCLILSNNNNDLDDYILTESLVGVSTKQQLKQLSKNTESNDLCSATLALIKF